MEPERNYFDAGVYMLKSRLTGATYIGATCFLRERLTHHVECILKRRHPNKEIRRVFRGHKQDDIELRVLERVEVWDRDMEGYLPRAQLAYGRYELMQRERHWITELQPSVNKNKKKRYLQLDIVEPEPDTAVSAA